MRLPSFPRFSFSQLQIQNALKKNQTEYIPVSFEKQLNISPEYNLMRFRKIFKFFFFSHFFKKKGLEIENLILGTEVGQKIAL